MANSYTSAGHGFGNQLARWRPSAKTKDAALLPNLNLGNARADDVVRNNAMASGAVQMHVDHIVGSLFRLSHKPRWQRLGISEADARSIARDTEAAFLEYAEDPVNCWLDAERKRTFTMMMRETVFTHTAQGESMAAALWLERQGTPFKTTIKMVAPKRVSNPNRKRDTNQIRGGVNVDAYGAALGFYVRNHHIHGQGGMGDQWEFIPRETPHGRQQFLHVFEPSEDGQTRGQNQFFQVLEQLHMLPKLQSTKLQNAIVNAMYAAVIETELGADAAGQIIGGNNIEQNLGKWLSQSVLYHDNADIKIDGVQVPHLVPGEKLNLLTSGNIDNGFTPLEDSILRWIARGTNVSHPSLAQNFKGLSYSTARFSMLEQWRYFMGRRKIIPARMGAMIFTLFFEELIDKREIVLPRRAKNFYEAKAAWCNCEFIGTGRMAIDGLKEVKEAVLRIEAGLSSYEKELAIMGEDYQEIFAQQVREMEERKKAGLAPPSWAQTQALAPDQQTEEQPSAESSTANTPGDR